MRGPIQTKGPVQTPKEQEDRDYSDEEVQEAAEALVNAEEVKMDKVLLALAKRAIQKKEFAIKKIRSMGDLKDAAYEKSAEEPVDEVKSKKDGSLEATEEEPGD